MASNRLLILCKTYGGKACKVALLVAAAVLDPSGGAVGALKTAIDALTKAGILGASISQNGSYSTTSAAGAYEDDQDKADFTFLDDVGQYHTYRIPAPNPSIFQDDNVSLDLSNAAVVAFAGYVTGNFVAPTGAALVQLTGGRRIRLKSGGRA